MIQYFFENLWLAWLLVGLLCLVLELTNGDFFIICFAIGGVVTAIVSTFRDRQKHEYILLKLRLWQFRKLRTLSDKAQIQQITSLHRSIYR